MSNEIFNEQVALVSKELVKLVNEIKTGTLKPSKGVIGLEFTKKVGDFRISADITPFGDIVCGFSCVVEKGEEGKRLFKDYNYTVLKNEVDVAEKRLKDAEERLRQAEE